MSGVKRANLVRAAQSDGLVPPWCECTSEEMRGCGERAGGAPVVEERGDGDLLSDLER
jgi:hypothetical protein